jgi:hypothetical protein
VKAAAEFFEEPIWHNYANGSLMLTEGRKYFDYCASPALKFKVRLVSPHDVTAIVYQGNCLFEALHAYNELD